MSNEGGLKDTEKYVHYFPASLLIPTTIRLHQNLVDAMLSSRDGLAAVVIQAACSGSLPWRGGGVLYQSFYTWLPKVACEVPVFIIPDASQFQWYPWAHTHYAEDFDGVENLETGCSGIADKVVADILEVLTRVSDRDQAVAEIVGAYKQTDRHISERYFPVRC